MKVAVIGAGIVGLSTARLLASRGHSVTVFEQFPLFHNRGSSHGRTRIVRRAYPDKFFTACMTEAYPLWAELEAESNTQLVTECGLMYVGSADAPRVQSMVHALTEIEVPHEVLDPAQSCEKIPEMRLQPDEVSVFTPEAGWVDAEAALRVSHALAEHHGAEFVQAKPDPLSLGREFDFVVVAAGGWIVDHAPLDVVVTRQTFGYTNTAIAGPVWIDDVTLAYGFPADALGQKVGAHQLGPVVHPDDPSQPYADHLGQIDEAMERRFGISSYELNDVTTCLYTSTPDEMFRIGWLGENVSFVSSCSGHGFKLGPWIGRLMAGIADGKPIPQEFAWPAK